MLGIVVLFAAVTNNPFKLKNVEIKCRTMTKRKKRAEMSDNKRSKVFLFYNRIIFGSC